MDQAILADAVLVVHALFILWSVLGGMAVLRWPRLAWLHLPALAWGVWIETSGGICPLTPLEVRLRTAAGQQGYEGGFIEHYLGGLIYPAGLTRSTQWLLAAVLAGINLVLYGVLLWRRARRRGIA